MRSNQPHREAPRRDFPAIYQSPTIETIDDGSLIASRRDFANVRSKAVYTPTRQVVTEIDTRPNTRHLALQYTPRKTPTRAMLSPPLVSRHVASRSTTRQRRRNRRQHDFQIDEDALHVTVKTVDIATRTVFDPIPPVSLEEWHPCPRGL